MVRAKQRINRAETRLLDSRHGSVPTRALIPRIVLLRQPYTSTSGFETVHGVPDMMAGANRFLSVFKSEADCNVVIAKVLIQLKMPAKWAKPSAWGEFVDRYGPQIF